MSFPLLRRGHVTRPRAGARATQTAQTKAISFALFLRAILIFDEIPPANPASTPAHSGGPSGQHLDGPAGALCRFSSRVERVPCLGRSYQQRGRLCRVVASDVLVASEFHEILKVGIAAASKFRAAPRGTLSTMAPPEAGGNDVSVTPSPSPLPPLNTQASLQKSPRRAPGEEVYSPAPSGPGTLLKNKLHLRQRRDGRYEIKPIDEVRERAQARRAAQAMGAILRERAGVWWALASVALGRLLPRVRPCHRLCLGAPSMLHVVRCARRGMGGAGRRHVRRVRGQKKRRADPSLVALVPAGGARG